MTYSYRFTDYIAPVKLSFSENGIASAKARIARVGIQNYNLGGKTYRVLRRPEVVSGTAHLFRDLPVTLNHPSLQDGGEVNESNKERLVKGWGSNTEYKEGWLETPVNIFASDAIAAAQNTHRYFSNGYKALLMDGDQEWDRSSKPQGGVWIDIGGLISPIGTKHEYDLEQIPIAGNHIALVLNGTARAGEGATFIDSEEIFLQNQEDFLSMDKLLELASSVCDMAGRCGYSDMIEYEYDGKSYKMPKSFKDMIKAYDGWMKSKMSDSDEFSKQFVDRFAYNAVVTELQSTKEEVAEKVKEISRLTSDQVDTQSLTSELESIRRELSDKQNAIAKLTTEKSLLQQKVSDALDPAKIEAMISDRQKAYDAASPFLDSIPFDATKESIYWKKLVLDSNQIDCTNFNPDQIAIAFEVATKTLPKRISQKNDSTFDSIGLLRQQEPIKLTPMTLPQYNSFS